MSRTGNTISMPEHAVPVIESIGMSNGLTSVFIEVPLDQWLDARH
ncbi:hypothetical protein ABGV42_13240 [Paenibacillus pabuli]